MTGACPFCDAARFETVFVYDAPPEGETAFDLPAGSAYHREFVQCEGCGHFFSRHKLDLTSLYEREYVTATYGTDGIRETFERIRALDPSRSDNAARVARVRRFAETRFGDRSDPPSLLDVGSGICVFLDRIKHETGWHCTALDMDPRQVAHARDVVGVEAVQGAFGEVAGLGRFDVIAFNKVLEHLQEPIAVLARAIEHLTANGFVYVEVPDGEAAASHGPEREEFFIDHWHAFSERSCRLMAHKAGFEVAQCESLHEPSGKFTLAAFLVPCR